MTKKEEKEFRISMAPLSISGLMAYIVSQIKSREKMEESYSEEIVALQDKLLKEKELYSKLLDKYIDVQQQLIGRI